MRWAPRGVDTAKRDLKRTSAIVFRNEGDRVVAVAKIARDEGESGAEETSEDSSEDSPAAEESPSGDGQNGKSDPE